MVQCGTLTVLPAVDDAQVAVESCSFSPDVLDLAEAMTVDVAVTVRNDNNADVAIDASLIVGGMQVTTLAGHVINAESSRTFNLSIGSFDYESMGGGVGADVPVDFEVTNVAHSTAASGSSFRASGCGSCGSSTPAAKRRVTNPLRQRR